MRNHGAIQIINHQILKKYSVAVAVEPPISNEKYNLLLYFIIIKHYIPI